MQMSKKQSIKLSLKKHKMFRLIQRRKKLQIYRELLVKSKLISNCKVLKNKQISTADYYAMMESQETTNAIYTAKKVLEKRVNKKGE